MRAFTKYISAKCARTCMGAKPANTARISLYRGLQKLCNRRVQSLPYKERPGLCGYYLLQWTYLLTWPLTSCSHHTYALSLDYCKDSANPCGIMLVITFTVNGSPRYIGIFTRPALRRTAFRTGGNQFTITRLTRTLYHCQSDLRSADDVSCEVRLKSPHAKSC